MLSKCTLTACRVAHFVGPTELQASCKHSFQPWDTLMPGVLLAHGWCTPTVGAGAEYFLTVLTSSFGFCLAGQAPESEAIWLLHVPV